MLAPALTLALAIGAPTQEALDYVALAQTFLSDAGAASNELSLDSLYAEHFDSLQLGVFEVRLPFDAFADQDGFNDIQRLAAALLEAQRGWLAIDHPDQRGWSEELEALDEALEGAVDWVEDWRYGEVAAKVGGGRRLRALCEPNRKQEAALDAVQAAREAGVLGPVGPVRLIWIPARGRFVEFIATVGYLEADWRGSFWVNGIVDWANTWVDDTRVVPLEYGDPGVSDYAKGLPLDYRNPKALFEQVIQVAHRAYLDSRFGDALDGGMASALANVLVIDQFGEVDTRTDGDLASRRSDARSIFIPGAPSNGGTLPPAPVDTVWRASQGADRFVQPLQESQKGGSKTVRDKDQKHRMFRLANDEIGVDQTVPAPILGVGASGMELEEGLEGEWQEFTRAYRTCFLYWLRDRFERKELESRERFASFLEAVAALEEGQSILDALSAIYEIPLSDAECSEDCLEGQFLRWLEDE
ncbi:MAG: hypothetical protein AAFZ65_02280 [Planctomycetota bacterium]